MGLLHNPATASALPPPEDPLAPPKPEPKAPPTFNKAADGFTWAAESRMEGWAAAWRPQTWPMKQWPAVETYDPDYVHPRSFGIVVQGCLDKSDFDLSIANKNTANTYAWKANGTVQNLKRCTTTLRFPAQGSYPVTLDVTNSAGKVVLSKTQTVRVKDLLIIAIGDSMSSGEGSPDHQRIAKDNPIPAQWVDRRCHRSKSAPAAQAAKAIEIMDPTTSVTFLSFACSGATLDKSWALSNAILDSYEANSGGFNNAGSGILGPYIGIESPAGDDAMDIVDFMKKSNGAMVASQVDQMRHALGGKRKADAVIMSAGLNDAGFSKLLFTCALYSNCPDEGVGFKPNQIPLSKRFAEDVKTIAPAYQRLGNEIKPMAKRVLVFEYPNPFTGDNKQTCDNVLEDVISVLPGPLALSMTKFESDWAQKYAEPLLHNAIRDGVQRAGFEYVGGVWNSFRGHGYCASNQNRWLRTAAESSAYQGPYMNKNTKGTIHPNFNGYHELSKFIVKGLTSPDENRFPVGVADTYTTTGNRALYVAQAAGVLINDTDPDLLTNLKVTNHTQPSGGKGSKVVVQPDGSFTYTPASGFQGTESFFYNVSDGIAERPAKVTITVTAPLPGTNPVVANNRTAIKMFP